MKGDKFVMTDFIGKGLGAIRSFFSNPNGSTTIQKVFLAPKDDLQNGQMKEISFQIGERTHKVLLSRVQDQYHATSHLCPHYKARLVTGVLSAEGKVVCPWHAACFDIRSGDIEEAPSVESLKKYNLLIENENIYLIYDQPEEFEQSSRFSCDKFSITKEEIEADGRVNVIVGGGAAGTVAAESMRKAGFRGKIIVISAENYLPIDRIKLTKVLDVSAQKIPLYKAGYLDQQLLIDFILGSKVVALNRNENKVELDNGMKINYDKILIATGGIPRSLPIPGFTHSNVFPIREISNNEGIKKRIAQLEDRKPRIVIIGASFIGMEAASMLSKQAESITVVGMENVPLERVLGDKVGMFFQRLHEKNGIKFKLGLGIKSINSKDDLEANEVKLSDGSCLEADLVIVGVGVRPGTDFCKDSINLQKDSSIEVDRYMKVLGCDNIYAAGDLATYPSFEDGKPVRIEHWDVAQQQGRIAGHNMATEQVDQLKPYNTVPFFFSLMFGKSIRYSGDAHEGYNEVYIEGDLDNVDSPSFAAYYIKNDKILAVATMGRDPLAVHCGELFAQKRMPSASEIKSGIV